MEDKKVEFNDPSKQVVDMSKLMHMSSDVHKKELQRAIDDFSNTVVTVTICGEKFAFVPNHNGMPKFDMEIYEHGRLIVSKSYETTLSGNDMVLFETGGNDEVK